MMRAPLISLLISAAGLAVAGCASSPQEEAPVASIDRACAGSATDPLHLTSNKPAAEHRDPEIEFILTQRGEPRLVWVNRQMYQTLHALDVELRREQKIAACERSQSGLQTLQAQAGGSGVGNGLTAPAGAGAAGSGGGGAAGGTRGGEATLAAADVTSTDAALASNAKANGAAISAMSGTTSRSALLRKSSLSSSNGGGNGATMPKVVAGNDNEIVARRLRKAAEQETDPALRQKLWKEYADYRQGIAAK
jgi:hypothetical protein